MQTLCKSDLGEEDQCQNEGLFKSTASVYIVEYCLVSSVAPLMLVCMIDWPFEYCYYSNH